MKLKKTAAILKEKKLSSSLLNHLGLNELEKGTMHNLYGGSFAFVKKAFDDHFGLSLMETILITGFTFGGMIALYYRKIKYKEAVPKTEYKKVLDALNEVPKLTNKINELEHQNRNLQCEVKKLIDLENKLQESQALVKSLNKKIKQQNSEIEKSKGFNDQLTQKYSHMKEECDLALFTLNQSVQRQQAPRHVYYDTKTMQQKLGGAQPYHHQGYLNGQPVPPPNYPFKFIEITKKTIEVQTEEPPQELNTDRLDVPLGQVKLTE